MTLTFLDKQFTLWLNSFHCSYFDAFFYLFTDKLIWLPLYVVLAWFILQRQGGRGLFTIIFIGLIVLVADQLSSSVIKPLVERYRPSRDDVMQYLIHIINGHRGGRYGFVSSHAANAVAVSTFFALVVKNKLLSRTLGLWALLTCYSRIYAGVHYAGDVLCGALLGAIIGAIAYQIYLRCTLSFFVISHHNKRTLKSGLAQMFGTYAPAITAGAFWLAFALIALSAYLITRYGTAC